jgi:hypothetical protein
MPFQLFNLVFTFQLEFKLTIVESKEATSIDVSDVLDVLHKCQLHFESFSSSTTNVTITTTTPPSSDALSLLQKSFQVTG